MEPLGGLDTAFVYCETPGMHMHVCGVVVLDAATARGDVFEQIRAVLVDAVPRVPLMAKRLAPVPLGIGRPFWVDDPTFDIDRHLHRVEIAPPGDDCALAELAGTIASEPLRHDRPLWETWVVEGLTDGRVALVAKMHHATIDGISAISVMAQLFDVGRQRPPKSERPPERSSAEPSPAGRHDRPPGPLGLLGRGLAGVARSPFELAGLVPPTVRHLGAAAGRMASRRTDRAAAQAPGTAKPFRAPRTSFNATLTARRSVAFAELSLDEMKHVKQAVGVKFNDVVTAVVGGALRRYLDERGETPDRALVAAEPVSVHARTGQLAGVTRLSMMFSTLATDIDDPLERLRVVAAANVLAKEMNELIGPETLLRWAEQVWPLGFTLGSRLYSGLHLADRHPVVYNLLLSNVAGPPVALKFAGARVGDVFPLGPLFDGAGLNITALSWEDRVGFGIVACPDLVPDVWSVAECLPVALGELVKAVG